MSTRHRRLSHHASSAFSLAEVVVVLVIVGVMAGMAVPRYTRSSARYRTDIAARRIAADLAMARERARTTSAAQAIVFDVALNRYQLPGVADLRRTADTYTVRMGDTPYQATLASPSFGGDATVIFDGFGRPDSGGSVVVSVGEDQKTITLAAETGEATIQ